MQSPAGPQATLKLASKKTIEPAFPKLSGMPETPEALFRAVALNVTARVDQPDPSGKGSTKRQEYCLPWAGFSTWRDARSRLGHFEKNSKLPVVWHPFNDSTSNDGPMSLNAYPGRAFIERVTNEGDANLEAKAAGQSGPMPSSPSLAAATWFGLDGHALSVGLDDNQLRAIAQNTVTVTGFVGNTDHTDSIFDARDFGIGLTGAEMPSTILSLNRGNKKNKPWLTGKHGQGASSTYQYADLTVIASRKIGSSKVAFTFVEASWDSENGTPPKTPTYKYFTIDGKIPEVEIPEQEFPAGTLIRHVGYVANELSSPLGENSLYGLLMRSLAEPIFPVWLEMFSLQPIKDGAYPTFAGYRRYGRLIRGTVNVLERAWKKTLAATPEDGNEPESSKEDVTTDDVRGTRMLHRASEYYQLPQWDYGGRTGVGDLGKVKMTWWVADPAGRRHQDVVRNWVDPDKTILMTLDGQTHAEESRAIVTGQNGAKLWAVGRYMVVQIDCNELDPKAKYAMFTSTREHAKETPIKKMILEELVRRLSFDKKLQELNVTLAAADVKQTDNKDDTITSLIKKYLKAAGISFDQLTRKVEKWTEVEEDQEVKASKREKQEPIPIEAVEPPTFVRWKFTGTSVKLYPGQRYSFMFETDAAPHYWNPSDQTASKIKVLGHAISYVGSGEMKGGRVRCYFECPTTAAIGSKGYIQVQLDYTTDASKTHRLPVDVVEKPKKPEHKEPGDNTEKDDKGDKSKLIRVKVRKKDFTEVEIPILQPIPVKQSDTSWNTLGWPHDPGRVGFSIRSLGGRIQLYYNAEFPPFLDLRHRMSKKSLETEFVSRYELKLVIHTMFTLNYDFADEEEFTEEQRKRIRNLLCATAESLALATKAELEIESKLKSEDGAPLAITVATNLHEDLGTEAPALAIEPVPAT
jgi:hypothetical protein